MAITPVSSKTHAVLAAVPHAEGYLQDPLAAALQCSLSHLARTHPPRAEAHALLHAAQAGSNTNAWVHEINRPHIYLVITEISNAFAYR